MAAEHDPTPENAPGRNEYTVSTRFMELVVSGLLMVAAAVVMYDSWRIGMGWAFDGPMAGYFPFYVGLIMFVCSAVTFLYNAFTKKPDLANFVDRSAFLLVLKVLVPTAVFVVLIGYVGLYVASALYIAFFMCWLGKYSVLKALPIAILIPLILFWMFEIAFLIPLPKGFVEQALGF